MPDLFPCVGVGVGLGVGLGVGVGFCVCSLCFVGVVVFGVVFAVGCFVNGVGGCCFAGGDVVCFGVGVVGFFLGCGFFCFSVSFPETDGGFLWGNLSPVSFPETHSSLCAGPGLGLGCLAARPHKKKRGWGWGLRLGWGGGSGGSPCYETHAPVFDPGVP